MKNSLGHRPRACQSLHITVFQFIYRYSLIVVPFLGACSPKILSLHTRRIRHWRPLGPRVRFYGFVDALERHEKNQFFLSPTEITKKQRRISRARTPQYRHLFQNDNFRDLFGACFFNLFQTSKGLICL